MAVHKLSEDQINPPLRIVPIPEDIPAAPLKPAKPPMREAADPEREARTIQILVQATATMTALAKIVSARFILLLSVIGAFILALFILAKPTVPSLFVMGFYVLVVAGVVALEAGVLAKGNR